ncbi:MAG: NAD-dependent epimerase/dehydratase family protein [Candidatus Accumulibacter sp.]|jgi:UDP-glucose 4-epimerase|nr:NAD-dependent epimerase/dehydratase family protein [Accumulibacter sp.]
MPDRSVRDGVAILVTGAAGFVGRALTARLVRRGPRFGRIMAATHDTVLPWSHPNLSVAHGKNLSPTEDWSDALAGISTVIHCAARVHALREAGDALALHRQINTAGTLNLARQSVAAGVRRFVFLSSIKVNGESTPTGRPFTADDAVTPSDPYGIAKMEAEQGLRELARGHGLEVVVVRPPLVYGPGAKANFQALMRALARGWPLPLGAVTRNRRSLVALDNLVDLLAVCAEHPAAAQRTFLVSDGEDLSTAALLRRLGVALGRPARLFPVPIAWLDAAAALLGRREALRRLCGSLQVDMRSTRETLGWTPSISVEEGLRRAAAAFRA